MSARRRRAWILTADKAGDNAQLRCLAGALDIQVEEKRIAVNPLYRIPNALLGSHTLSLKSNTIQQLNPPWPDLLLASGRRSVPAAMYIRQRSQGHTRLVHLGRPWAPLHWFDLILSPRYYGLPEGGNVVGLDLPLNRLPIGEQPYAPPISPYAAVLLGGKTTELRFGPAYGTHLAQQLNDFARWTGLLLRITGSPRTPAGALKALQRTLTVPYELQQRSGTAAVAQLVGQAQAVVVTGDSASMVAEAAYSAKPVLVVPVPSRGNFRHGWSATLEALLPASVLERLLRTGLVIAPRGLTAAIGALQHSGQLGTLSPLRWPERPLADELPQIAVRIRELLGMAATDAVGAATQVERQLR